MESVCIATDRQHAFKVAQDGKLLPALMSNTGEGSPFRIERHAETIPDCLGCSIAGDEKQEGPAFNYARIFTWWNVARRVHQAFETTAANMERRNDLDEKPVPRELKFKQRNLRGDTLRLSRYCGLAREVGPTEAGGKQSQIVPEELSEYPRWGDLDSAFYRRIVVAATMGFFVQWGTTGAAIIISYLTEVRGLGCRSGGYMLYGILGTASFVLLFASSMFSHAAMLRHEDARRKRRHPGGEEPGSDHSSSTAITPPFTSSPSPSASSPLTAFRVLAVTTRMLGRVLAVTNGLWILLGSLWELIGFYDMCFCDGVFLSRGWGGWILLFRESAEMARAARQPWAGGVSLSVFVVAGSCCIFWLYCRGNRA